MTYEEYKHDFYEKLMNFHNSEVDNDKVGAPETRVIFLDGDYGWGKTRLIKSIKEEQKDNISMEIYSPWLSVNDKNIIVDLWSFLKKFDIRKSYRIFYLLSLIATVMLISATIFASALTAIVPSNWMLFVLLAIILILAAIVLFCTWGNKILEFVSYKENAYEKFYGYYIDDIVDKMPQILFIEDVDRLDRHELLILLKMVRKISDVINEKKIKKTLVLTGSAMRVISKCDQVGEEPRPGKYVMEDSNIGRKFNVFGRVVSQVIKFYSVEDNISELLKKENIDLSESILSLTIILNLIRYYDITVRDFVRFLASVDNPTAKNLILEFVSWYFSEKVIGDYKKGKIEQGMAREKTFLFTTESQIEFNYIPIFEVELMLQSIEGFQNITFDIDKFAKIYFEMKEIPTYNPGEDNSYTDFNDIYGQGASRKRSNTESFFRDTMNFPIEFHEIINIDKNKMDYKIILENSFLKDEIEKTNYNSSKELLIAMVFYLGNEDVLNKLFPKLFERLKKN